MHPMAMPIIRLISSLHTPFASIGSDSTRQAHQAETTERIHATFRQNGV
jgi:hypothetical protein